jgi:hypothetical protein
VPYIGDESISVPPRSKNTLSTCARWSRRAASAPTLKVIQEPMPITGTCSPVAGIALVKIGPIAAFAKRGPRAAGAPSMARNARRLTSGLARDIFVRQVHGTVGIRRQHGLVLELTVVPGTHHVHSLDQYVDAASPIV